MRERGALFSGDMVRRMFDDSKTQTRRPIAAAWWRCLDAEDAADRAQALTMCPLGVPGDRIWVRETFYCDHVGALRRGTDAEIADWLKMTYYRADFADEHAWANADEWAEGTPPWTPSIHMPRWASRLTLEITDVRVERLQDISEYDALAEGIGTEPRGPTSNEVWYQGAAHPIKGFPKVFPTAVQAYESLWDSLYAMAGTRWSDNPWVWCLSFRRIESADARQEAIHA